MMLVQKQPVFNLSQSVNFAHRRHPSAPPAVIVQPTRTPGLLSLSKPHQPLRSPVRALPSNQRHQPHQKQSPKPKQAQVVRAPAPVLAPAAKITDKKPSAVDATSSPQPRGRAARHLKDSQTEKRSASHSSVRGKHGRQPSPPIPQAQQQQDSSQAEALFNTTSNLFDPFLDDTSSAQMNEPAAPSLASRPSGKLARRRQHNQQATAAAPIPKLFATNTPSPAQTKAISMAKPPRTRNNNSNNNTGNVSRSEPGHSHMPTVFNSTTQPKRTAAARPFPVCDDSTDTGDLSDAPNDFITPPTTPTRPRPASFQYDAGPRTAPLSGRTPGFPFNLAHPPSPAPTKYRSGAGSMRVRQHQRTPSEGIFSMSSDEEVASGPAGASLNPSVQALFGLVRIPAHGAASTDAAPYSPSTPGPGNRFMSREEQLEREAEKEVKGYFASSLFQNSPSPEELPDPVFV